MAMVCVTGARECEGCQSCRPEPKAVYSCTCCGDPLFAGDDYYSLMYRMHNDADAVE